MRAVLFAMLTGLLLLSACARNISPYSRASVDMQTLAQSEYPPAPYGAAELGRLGWQKWLHLGESDEAEKLWLKAVEIDGERSEAYAGLALLSYFRGRVNLQLENWAMLLERYPDSPFAEIAARQMNIYFAYYGDFITRFKPLFVRLLDDPRVDYATRLAVLDVLEKIYMEEGDENAVISARKLKGEVRRFIFAGPFGQFGQIDFDRVYPPEEETPLLREYQDDGFTVKTVQADLEIREDDFSLLGKKGGVYYAVSYIKTLEDQEVILRLSGWILASMRIDSLPPLIIDSRSAYLPYYHQQAVRLKAGWHRILLKFGDDGSNPAYRLRIYGTDGKAPQFEQFAAFQEQPAFDELADSNIIKAPVSRELLWNEALRDDPSNVQAMLARLLLDYSNGDYEAMKPLIERGLKEAPQFAPLHIIKALKCEKDPSSSRKVMQDQARRAYEKAYELDSTLGTALYETAQRDIAEDRISEAIAKLNHLQEMAPGYNLWQTSLYSIYNSRGWHMEAEQALAEAIRINPRDRWALKQMYMLCKSEARYAEAEKLALRLDELSWVGDRLADWLYDTGHKDEAEKLMQRNIRRETSYERLKMDLAERYAAAGDYSSAAEVYRRLLDRPDSVQSTSYNHLRGMLAETLQYMGRFEDAATIHREILENEAESYHIRNMLTISERRELLSEYVTSGDEVISKFKSEEFGSEAESVMVLDEYIVQMMPNGSYIGRTHMIKRVQTKAALSKAGEISLPDNGAVYKVRIIKADGRVLAPENISGKDSGSLPDLEVGDFIEYDYVTGSSVDRRFRTGLLGMRFYFRNMETPTYCSRFTIINPADMDIKQFAINYEDLAAPEIVTENGLTITRYENEKLKEITPEPFMPLNDEIFPIVDVSLPLNYTDIRDYYRQSLLRNLRPSYELQSFLAENWPSEKSACKDEKQYDCVKALYYAIAKKVEGDNQSGGLASPATAILQAGQGNRLVVLSALLKMLNIKSDFLLTRPVNVKKIDFPNASLKMYDSALLRIVLEEGREIYTDADFKYSTFGKYSPLISGAEALALDDNTNPLTTVPFQNSHGDQKDVTLYCKLSESGAADCESIEEIAGYYSASLRGKMEVLPQDQLRQFFESVLNQNFPGTSLKDLRIDYLDDPEKPLTLHYIFRSDYFARSMLGKLFIERAFYPLNLAPSYIRIPVRNYDLMVNFLNAGRLNAVIELPDNWDVTKVPSGRRIDSVFGSYTYEIKRDGRMLEFNREITIPVQRILPQDYLDFARFCSTIDNLEQAQTIIEPASSASDSDVSDQQDAVVEADVQ